MANDLSKPFRLVALGLVMVAVMVVIVLAPRLFGLETMSWWVTVAVGAVIGAVVAIAGYAKRDSGESHIQQAEE